MLMTKKDCKSSPNIITKQVLISKKGNLTLKYENHCKKTFIYFGFGLFKMYFYVLLSYILNHEKMKIVRKEAKILIFPQSEFFQNLAKLHVQACDREADCKRSLIMRDQIKTTAKLQLQINSKFTLCSKI